MAVPYRGDGGDARQARVHEEEQELGGSLLGWPLWRSFDWLLLRLHRYHVTHSDQGVALGDATRLRGVIDR